MSLKDFITLETVDGAPVTAHGYRVTPQAQAVIVRQPFARFVWNRPLAVKVLEGENQVRIPIVDVTRVTQVIIYALAAFLMLLLRRAGRKEQ